MDDLKEEDVIGCFVSLFTVIFSILITLYQGFVLKYCWHYFISLTFGIKDILLVQAIGLTLIISLLTYTYIPATKEQIEKGVARVFAESLASRIIVISSVWFSSWIFTKFL